MVSPEQQQQQNAWAGQYAPQPPPNMGMGISFSNPATFGNNYFYQQSYVNSPQMSNGQPAPAITATFAPQHVGQQHFTMPPPARQGPPASAQDSHPSDVFRSLDEAMATMPPRNWRCPINDPTLPATDGDRQQWVQMLLDAVNNITDVQGKQNDVFKKRWLVDPLTELDYYLPLDKLILCWTIEDLVERMHRVGPSVLHSFDDGFWESAAKTSDWTFQYRMIRIIELLTVSKTRCNSLLGGSGMQSIVANPGEKLVATKLQVKQNEKRGKILKIGRAAKKQKTSAYE